MRKIIKIAQFASGSRTDRIGDTTLFYTDEYSRHASDVSGIFLDNPPVLSATHASLVWRYYHDSDIHTLIHVQGSHVVNSALGRIYPFRAAYEVSRSDMNSINYLLGSLMAAMPRINDNRSNQVSPETAIDVRESGCTIGGRTLATHIKKALASGWPLYLGLHIPQKGYREDGIFEAEELETLLSAIESLPLNQRRYISFGFCVDGHFSYVLDGVLVVVYDAERPISIPEDAINISWQQAVSEPAVLSTEDNNILSNIELPGLHSKLLDYKDLTKAVEVSRKPTEQLQGSDWPIWLMLNHSLAELNTDSWSRFGYFYNRMDEETQRAYVDSLREASLKWSGEGLNKDLFNLMNYDPASKFKLQRRALRSYLQSGRNSFLFESGLTDELKELLNEEFLSRLDLKDRDSVEQWYSIFKRQGRLDDPKVKMSFARLFETYVVPQIQTLEETMHYMRRYPFIPARAYSKPSRMTRPEGLEKLDSNHRALIEQWLQEEIDAHSFSDIDQVLNTIRIVCKEPSKSKEIDAQALMSTDASTLFTLLTKKGDKDELLWRSENLLRNGLSLPKAWNDFMTDSMLPAVRYLLFGSKKMPSYNPLFDKESLLNVSKWGAYCQNLKRYPNVYMMVEDEIRDLIGADSRKTIYKAIKETYINRATLRHDAEAVKAQKKGKESGRSKTYQYLKGATEAKPLIDTYIKTIKKYDKNMAKDLKRLFKDLKGAKNQKRQSKLNLLYGLIAGIVLCVAVGLAYHLLFTNEKEEFKGATLTWQNKNQENLIAQIADIGEIGTISKVSIDTFTVENVSLDKTVNLLPIAEEYYRNPSTPSTDAAKACIYLLPSEDKAQEAVKTDTIAVTQEEPLLMSVCKNKYRISQVIVRDTIKIDIPNKEILDNDTTGLSTVDTKYYFRVVRYLKGKLPKDVDIAY